MGYTLSEQGICFLWSIVCGVMISVIYDVFSLIRLLFTKIKISVFICDFIFMILSSLVTVLFSIAFTRGYTRYFVIIGEVIGFFAYRLTLGRYTVRALGFILNKFFTFLRKTADKIIKTSKKLLQVTIGVLYNIIRSTMIVVRKLFVRRGRRYNENKETSTGQTVK